MYYKLKQTKNEAGVMQVIKQAGSASFTPQTELPLGADRSVVRAGLAELEEVVGSNWMTQTGTPLPAEGFELWSKVRSDCMLSELHVLYSMPVPRRASHMSHVLVHFARRQLVVGESKLVFFVRTRRALLCRAY